MFMKLNNGFLLLLLLRMRANLALFIEYTNFEKWVNKNLYPHIVTMKLPFLRNQGI